MSTTCEVGWTSSSSPSSTDQLDVIKDFGEFAAEALDLLGGEFEAGKAGDMKNLVAAEHCR